MLSYGENGHQSKDCKVHDHLMEEGCKHIDECINQLIPEPKRLEIDLKIFKVVYLAKEISTKLILGILSFFGTGSWVTGLHWQPKRRSSLEDKPGRERKEVGKGQ